MEYTVSTTLYSVLHTSRRDFAVSNDFCTNQQLHSSAEAPVDFRESLNQYSHYTGLDRRSRLKTKRFPISQFSPLIWGISLFFFSFSFLI